MFGFKTKGADNQLGVVLSNQAQIQVLKFE